MKRIVFAAAAALAAAALCHPLAGATTPGATTLGTATTRPATSQPLSAAQLRLAGLERALAGDFRTGFDLITKATRLAPDDRVAASAGGLLADYLQHDARAEAERAEEYAEAVRRVQRCQLAQLHLPKLKAAGMEEALHKKVEEMVAAYRKASDGIAAAQSAQRESGELRVRAASDRREAAALREQAGLPPATTAPTTSAPAGGKIAELEAEAASALKKAEELEKQAAKDGAASLKALRTTAGALKEAVEILKKDTGTYAETFGQLTDEALRRLEQFGEAWQSSASGSDGAHDSQNLKTMEEKLAEGLADVSMLATEEPWRSALVQARLAKRLAREDDSPGKQPWYQALLKEVEARAAEAETDTRWYDALAAWAGLHDLEPDSERYRTQVLTIRRHVRALTFYGGDDAGTDDAEWRQMVAGVDAEMVKSVISQLRSQYVSAVDYRDLARAALESIRTLADTPQVTKAFPKLADAERKEQFLDAVARQLKYVDLKDRMDHLELVIVLNGVLRASERTVEIPTEVLAVEFTDGLLSALDKFSSMVWPHDMADFKKNTMGEFFGVGIQMTKELNEPLKVVTPLADSPALQAGIRTDDLIVGVNGKSTRELSLSKLVTLIMGEKGTKVVLTIERRGRPAPFDVEIIRDQINIKTVKGWERMRGGKWRYLVDPDGRVGYIRVTQFTDKTPEEIRAALDDLRAELPEGVDKVESLILDLRFNPGGLLQAARQVADEFLRDGRIVSTRGRTNVSHDLNATRSGAYLAGDLVVLVNEQSASAAEIVSGALKDWQRGLVLGERTYGKGSVQKLFPIRDRKALLKLTTAYYYLPSGRLLHRKNGQKDWGVDPDIAVMLTPRQTKRWLEIRRETDLLRHATENTHLQDDLKRQYDEDLQLQTAVLLLRLMRLRAQETS